MAEKETKNNLKDLIEPVPEEVEKEKTAIEEIEGKLSYEEVKKEKEKEMLQQKLGSWVPKTQLGKDVKSGKEKSIDNILSNRKKILESEIVDLLIKLEQDMLLVGQAKGKFGGGKRRAWRQTQKKTKEGNVLTFSAMAVVGDKNGHVGIGYGRSKETLPAREKAVRNAKLNIIKVERGCAHFDCLCSEPHTIPFVIEGKAGSVRIRLRPAPQGTGLVAGDEVKKILRLAGIKDIYTETDGNVRTTINLAKACLDALRKTSEVNK